MQVLVPSRGSVSEARRFKQFKKPYTPTPRDRLLTPELATTTHPVSSFYVSPANHIIPSQPLAAHLNTSHLNGERPAALWQISVPQKLSKPVNMLPVKVVAHCALAAG